MRQDLQRHFNTLKTKSLSGDASATAQLDQMCQDHQVGSLAEIMPLVKRHLHTLPPPSPELDGWMEWPAIRNTLSTINLLTHFLNKETPDASALDRLCDLSPFLVDWVSFLFRSMGIPDEHLGTPIPLVHSVVVHDISQLLLTLFPFPTLLALLSTPNHLLLLIRDTWIWASEMGHDRVSKCVGGVLLAALSFEDVSESPVSQQGVHQIILGRPIEVGKTAVHCLVTSLDLELPTTKFLLLQSTLDTVFRIRRRSDEARRSMIASDVLRWLCILARRLTTMHVTASPDEVERIGRIILLLVQEISVFLSLTYGGLRIALQHHLMESFLRLEPFIHSSLFFRSTEPTAHNLQMVFPEVISRFECHLIFRSCLPLIRRSVREAQDMHLPDQLRRGGEVEATYRQFLDSMTVRGDWLDRYLSSEAQRCFCVNPACACKTRSGISCPITMKKCTRCLFTTYCSRACQKEHWKVGGHRIHCTRLQSARAGGTNLLPVSPKDTEMIYALIRHQMADRPGLFSAPDSQTDSYHLQKDWEWPVENSNVVFRFDFSSSADGLLDTLGFVSLNEITSVLSLTSEVFMYQAHWDGCLARACIDGDPPVLITMSGLLVIEVTSFRRISKSLYPVEIFEDTST